MTWLPVGVFALFLLVLPARAAELPDLGESARATVSLAAEGRLGREIMRRVRGDRGFLDDPEVSEYLNALGARLAAASHAPDRDFSFFAVRDPMINAFALPGGYIGVHTGLISAAQDESELAGVLAHEIGHVTQNHLARMVDSQRGSALATLAAMAIAILAARSDNAQIGHAALTTAQALSLQSQLDFTREHEREADRVGLQTVIDAGFPAAGMVSFFDRLLAQGRLYENRAPSYLRTHPLSHERMADLQGRLTGSAVRQRLDSQEFTLVRAKIQAAEGEARDAMGRFSALVASRDDLGSWYGLAASALRGGAREQAARALTQLDQRWSSPMLDTLAAEILLAEGRLDAALLRVQSALGRYPTYRPLVYAYARVLQRAGRSREAKSYVQEQLRVWSDDPRLYGLLAEADLSLGLRAEGHLAQAEAYLREDRPTPALEQLQLARQAGDGDFYTLSVVDARLRDLRERQRREARDELR